MDYTTETPENQMISVGILEIDLPENETAEHDTAEFWGLQEPEFDDDPWLELPSYDRVCYALSDVDLAVLEVLAFVGFHDHERPGGSK